MSSAVTASDSSRAHLSDFPSHTPRPRQAHLCFPVPSPPRACEEERSLLSVSLSCRRSEDSSHKGMQMMSPSQGLGGDHETGRTSQNSVRTSHLPRSAAVRQPEGGLPRKAVGAGQRSCIVYLRFIFWSVSVPSTFCLM